MVRDSDRERRQAGGKRSETEGMETISVYVFEDGGDRMLKYLVDSLFWIILYACKDNCRRSGVSSFNCNWRGLPWDSKELATPPPQEATVATITITILSLP